MQNILYSHGLLLKMYRNGNFIHAGALFLSHYLNNNIQLRVPLVTPTKTGYYL